MTDQNQNPAAVAGAIAPETPAPKKHKAVTLGRFMLTAPQPNARAGADTPAKMYWASYRGNPRIVIHTNDPADSENMYGKINASMDMMTFEVLMARLEFVSNAEPGYKEKIGNLSTYKGSQRFDTPQLVNSTLIGKDEDGRVWISVVEDSRPTPRFFFQPGEYHQVIRRDGTPLPPAEASVWYTQATVRGLRGVMAVLHARNALGDEPEEDGVKVDTGAGGGWKNNNGGGWKGGQGGGGGWQNRQGGGQSGGWKGGQGNGGGGGWQNRQGGGGGNWQNRQGGGGGQGGGWQNRQGGGQGGGTPAAAVPANLADSDLTF